MPAYRVIAPPVSEPVSLVEMKNWLRQDQSVDDAMISGLISSARSMCETFTDRVLVTQTRAMLMDAFPGYADRYGRGSDDVRTISTGVWQLIGGIWGFRLPVAPVQSVISLTYNDLNGNPQTLTPGVNYNVDIVSNPGRIFPAFGTFWPFTQYAPNAVTVQFVCGYGVPSFDPTTGAPTSWVGQPVPESFRTSIQMIGSWFYNNRDSNLVTTGVIRANPSVATLLSQYRDF